MNDFTKSVYRRRESVDRCAASLIILCSVTLWASTSSAKSAKQSQLSPIPEAAMKVAKPGKPSSAALLTDSILAKVDVSSSSVLSKSFADKKPAPLSELLSCAVVCDERLEPVIHFWLRVFTEINSRQAFVHDARYPERVFTTVSMPKAHKRFVRNTLRQWKKRLLTLANTAPKNYSEQQRRWVQTFGNLSDENRIKEIQKTAHRLRLQRGHADHLRIGLKRSGRYRQQIGAILKSQGVPEVLLALPLIESSYSKDAYSSVGAAGVWQFMRSTARRYITVNQVIDERLDPIIATEAAAQFLAYNYSLTQSWPLAITAYNHGIAGVLRAKRQLKTDDIHTIIHNYNGRRFRFASRNFFVELLAAWAVYKDPTRYFPDLQIDKEVILPHIQIERGLISASDLARALGLSTRQLRSVNHHYRRAVWSETKLLPIKSKVYLPFGSSAEDARLALTRSSANVWQGKQRPDRFHTIRRGETVSTIAAYYGVRQSSLLAANNLRGSRIYAGRQLILPHAADKLSTEELSALQKRLNPARQRSRQYKRSDTEMDKWLIQLENKEISEEEFIRLLRTRKSSVVKLAQAEGEAVGELEGDLFELNENGNDDELRLLADPSDYVISEDGFLVTLFDETLGHYADWLDIPTQRLRRLNSLRYGRALPIGKRLRLDFSRVDKKTFYHRRLVWHLSQQDEFFARYKINNTVDYRVQRRDSIWEIVHRQRISPPLWLVQQFNPELNMTSIRRGQIVRLPELVANTPQ